ncbi:ABC-F family ATP-binding cassette domain-containing protein [Cronobacter malonaticus]|uniref:ABC-F family ATP-binding cassette domain-containing protein n=1 Tax=Cronobacter malonaticus TaxID=413503 RepID=UPI000519B320|nr:ABC-F family ATP-binding cassette domain-containing protein [Cronobacter malonaticus]EGT4382268.1 ABC transporter ATP-binding protein [Cronobacter malonaticus]EGT4419379.1 ABC transporter ATP-binding protein [Cronobacter malonaticus]EGT4444429.1 ABC transporter ATP-binding protein [Cronobacter malonaticus]EGT4453462.1 ABC transporter ATP-binding protein [Cronobacter malonaticus]EKP4390938.1 ABC-F family ATP-binding cassette domain-containing protein [Cronobacter malonaticus]
MSTLLTAHSLRIDSPFGPVLNALSFTLKKGDRIGLIGHNGCGKSTLLKALDGTLAPAEGVVTRAARCLLARVEQHLPDELHQQTLLEALLARLPEAERESSAWRAQALLANMGFAEAAWSLTAGSLSGGQHTRLLLARALIVSPDLLLLDEPGNHLDLPTLLWLEQFLARWNGSFILVSHDSALLDGVTNRTWILRDGQLQAFDLPCTQARAALAARDESDAMRHKAEQKEIDRVTASAKRLATWGQVYDNEDLARKAKQMEKQVARLKEEQTELAQGSRWRLTLSGDALAADRLLELENLAVSAAPDAPTLFTLPLVRLKSGDRVALLGHNGCGKSSLLRLLWRQWQTEETARCVTFHPRVSLGYYDQSLHQLPDDATLLEALEPFAPELQQRKLALISAGFPWARHGQRVDTLSGGERSRLLFIGLSLARYSLLMLDEPTNHLDMEGKEALAQTLQTFAGGLLLVTHDRTLMEASCNRFWLVEDGGLSEWHNMEALMTRLRAAPTQEAMDVADAVTAPSETNSDAHLLERLIELEARLNADLERKPRHQKPALQAEWRKEIAHLSAALGLE